DSYAGYMTKVAGIAQQSNGDGKQVATTLATPGLKVPDLVTKLRGIADQERQNVQAAQRLDPPGRLRDENTHLIEALQLRVRGVATGGAVTGLHGTNIESVSAEPGGQTLSTGSLNTVTASTDLAFAVVVKDSGDAQEVQIPVQLTISGGSTSITRKKTIQV